MKAWALKEKKGLSYFEAVFPLKSGSVRLLFTSRRGGFSSKNYSSLNLSYTVGEEREVVDKNYERLKAVLGMERIATLTQVHSDRIVFAQTPWPKREGDALLTQERNLYLGVTVADCLPLLFFGERGEVIGICHIGWRGALLNLPKKMVREMKNFLHPTSSLFYSLLPSISGRCYEIGEEVFFQFQRDYPSDYFKFFTRVASGYFLDLRGFVRHSLNEENLSEYPPLEYCSHCEGELFYSKRRDGLTGRNLALIALLP